MSDPRWTVDLTVPGGLFWTGGGGFDVEECIHYFDPDDRDVTIARDALVECVRSHDTLTRARQLARRHNSMSLPGYEALRARREAMATLLDLLTGEGQ